MVGVAVRQAGEIPEVGGLAAESAYLRDFSYLDDSRRGGGSRRPYSERMQAGDFPRAAIIAGRLDVVPYTGSTNADLLAAVAVEPDAYPHLSVLVTDDQRAGRGRLDRTWTAPAGAALAISVLVRVTGIPADQRGWVPLIAGAAMTRALRGQFAPDAAEGGPRVGLKWPNDVLIDGAKVCGILSQMLPGEPDAIVVGAGVNTRMTPGQLPVPTATSLAIAGADVDLDRLLADYLQGLRRMLAAAVSAEGGVGVRAEVRELCATLGSEVRVMLPDERTLEGRATGLDDAGRLIVAVGGESVPVAAGDVIHVR